ncbi:hypothetical protein LTS17_009417 [Exophiala oligosperma]
MKLFKSLATLALLTLFVGDEVWGSPFATIEPCPSATSMSLTPITVSAQYQPVTTCQATIGCIKGKCSTIYGFTTFPYVSTVVPCAWDGTTTRTTTVTDVSQQLIASTHIETLTKTKTLPATHQLNWMDLFKGQRADTSTTTLYQTVTRQAMAPFNAIGPLAIPDWNGSGLCEKCTDDDGALSQLLLVTECRSGTMISGKEYEKCVEWYETLLRQPPDSVTTGALCSSAGFIPHAGFHTWTFPQSVPPTTVTTTATVTLTISGRPTISIQPTIRVIPGKSWDAEVTKSFSRPTTFNFQLYVTKVLVFEALPATHTAGYPHAISVPSGTHGNGGSDWWPLPTEGSGWFSSTNGQAWEDWTPTGPSTTPAMTSSSMTSSRVTSSSLTSLNVVGHYNNSVDRHNNKNDHDSAHWYCSGDSNCGDPNSCCYYELFEHDVGFVDHYHGPLDWYDDKDNYCSTHWDGSRNGDRRNPNPCYYYFLCTSEFKLYDGVYGHFNLQNKLVFDHGIIDYFAVDYEFYCPHDIDDYSIIPEIYNFSGLDFDSVHGELFDFFDFATIDHVIGGHGGGNAGGRGALVKGSIEVSGGETLSLIAGGAGAVAVAGQSNYGSGGTASEGGGGGGGASALYLSNNLLAVAGGGGGQGNPISSTGQAPPSINYSNSEDTSDAGTPGVTRYIESLDGGTVATSEGGRPGSLTGPGAGGMTSGYNTGKQNGNSGNGHDGGNGIPDLYPPAKGSPAGGSGGGGGGYWGGGSGANLYYTYTTTTQVMPAGGGGGSSYVDATVSDGSESLSTETEGSIVVVFS